MSNGEPEPPQYVINEWLKQCDCCHECGQMRPCNGVMAGGLCDGACNCEDVLGEPPFCARCGGTCQCEDYYDDEI